MMHLAARAALLFANILIPGAILLFASGFFPYKPFLPGLATFNELQDGASHHGLFDKVVFMVVDALRSDFVYSTPSGFEFTQSLIRSGNAIPFTAHASSPTITMPRVKAITTGSVPSFLDVILNFAESDKSSTLAYQDTWLAQVRAHLNGSLVLYGDDTWLKLFPDTFMRHDGTSSFFVSDFTEVDNNVTRHIPDELSKNDWSGMILHFLGLDHIGHKSGPRSPHMIPKQKEMDFIIEQIYTAIQTKPHLQSCLLVLCGDHGMNDAGNHGASSPGETSAALAFMSPKFQAMFNGTHSPVEYSENFQYHDVVEQSDIAPTLAGLLGFPIPLNNLGTFIPQFLNLWDSGVERVDMLLSNADQLLGVVRETFPTQFASASDDEKMCQNPSDIGRLICEWYNVKTIVERTKSSGQGYNEALAALSVFCKNAQEIMSSTASNYDIPRLQMGIAVASCCVVLSLLVSFNTLSNWKLERLIITIISISFAGMMMASSYVEEEQQFWYWAIEAWLCLLYIKETHDQTRITLFPGVYSALLLISTRFVRRWNQTGQKFAGESSITTAFYADHTLTFWILLLATYAEVCQRLRREVFSWASPAASNMLASMLTGLAFLFKIAFTFADAPELFTGASVVKTLLSPVRDTHLVLLARLVFLSLALSLLAYHFMVSKIPNKQGKGHHPHHVLLTVLLITQTRATNIPLFLIGSIQLYCLTVVFSSKLCNETPSAAITITSILLQHVFFFAMGGSNAISSIDLSSAYNGVRGYNVLIVAMLTFISNWAGPIWWVSGTGLLFDECSPKDRPTESKPKTPGGNDDDERTCKKVPMSVSANSGNEESGWIYVSVTTFFTSIALLGVMIACMVLRTHLFIWTVFSPKYLYSMAWSLGQHFLVNVIGGLVFALK